MLAVRPQPIKAYLILVPLMPSGKILEIKGLFYYNLRGDMPQHFCHNCAAALGIPASPQTQDPLASHYQLAKFVKHTALGTIYPINSIFADPGTASYANYVVSTAGSGWFQVDDQGR